MVLTIRPWGYLTSRKQRTKISDIFSSWQEILSEVPQGSILGPLLFNIGICNLFFIIEDYDIANYADDNTPYLSRKNVEKVLRIFRERAPKPVSMVYWKHIER